MKCLVLGNQIREQWGLGLNNKTAYERVLLKRILYSSMIPSVNSPPLVTHWSILFFHRSKHCWKSSFVGAFRSSADFCFTSSIDSNWVPFKANFIFGKRKRSQDSKSGEYSVWSSTGVPQAAKKRFADNVLWGGALPYARSATCFSTTTAISYELGLAVLPKLSNNKFGSQFDPLKPIQSSQRC